jgi:hypothetical protein
VQLFQPPAGPLLSRWELAADITQQLQQHMEETDWQVCVHSWQCMFVLHVQLARRFQQCGSLCAWQQHMEETDWQVCACAVCTLCLSCTRS